MSPEVRWEEKFNNVVAKRNPSNLIFAFDLHDVVLHIDLIGMIKELFTTWEGLQFVLAISILNPIVSLFLIYIFAKRMLQKFWAKPDMNAISSRVHDISTHDTNSNELNRDYSSDERDELINHDSGQQQTQKRWNFLMGGSLSNLENDIPSVVVEQIWFELVVAKFPSLQAHNNFFIKLANKFSLKEETALLIKSLKKKGYKIYLFSNIGNRFWADMQTRFPQVFSLLDGIQVATSADNYLAKPHPSSYQKFLSTFNKDDCHVIFLDDSVTNLAVAEVVSNKFIPYRFTTGSKLKEDFCSFLND